jgi:hypothetical protein
MYVLIGVIVAVIVIALALLAFRQAVIFYGLTDVELIDDWPGDHAVAGAMPSGTRAITIHRPAEDVWPWIAQIGQDRAGFYSYRWLENVFGAKMPEVKVIVPRWTERSVGQKLVMAPVERWGKIAEMDLVDVEPNRHLVYVNREGSWSFILAPISDRACRLVCRGTWIPSRRAIARLMRMIVFDTVHFVMEWKMMRTIKRLAESA